MTARIKATPQTLAALMHFHVWRFLGSSARDAQIIHRARAVLARRYLDRALASQGAQ